jgi:hypothetical protein
MLRFMAHSANAVAHERGLNIRFQVLTSTQLMVGTALGREVASDDAALEGLTVEEYPFKPYATPLPAQYVDKQVADMPASVVGSPTGRMLATNQ